MVDVINQIVLVKELREFNEEANILIRSGFQPVGKVRTRISVERGEGRQILQTFVKYDKEQSK